MSALSSSTKEALVVCTDEQEQQTMQKFLLDLGVLPTLIGNPIRASELMQQKSFAFAIVDADTPVQGAGIELVRALHKIRPEFPILLLVNEESFSVAVAAVRAGARDLFLKDEHLLTHLGPHVLSLCMERPQPTENGLIAELWALAEEFLHRLTKMGRQFGEVRDQLHHSDPSLPPPQPEQCRILIVDNETWLSDYLLSHLPAGFSLSHVQSGGEALDHSQSAMEAFHITLVSESLPDLSGRMVLRSLTTQSPETIGVLFQMPNQAPGQAQIIDGSKMISLIDVFTSAEQILSQLKELRDAQVRRKHERKYVVSFQKDHYDLLRRYTDLKNKIGR